jgi:hypothetical protein
MSRAKKLKNSLWLMFMTTLSACADATDSPTSDHFDGKRFFNPTLSERFSLGLSDAWRMARESGKPWPQSVENKGVPRLHVRLGRDPRRQNTDHRGMNREP